MNPRLESYNVIGTITERKIPIAKIYFVRFAFNLPNSDREAFHSKKGSILLAVRHLPKMEDVSRAFFGMCLETGYHS